MNRSIRIVGLGRAVSCKSFEDQWPTPGLGGGGTMGS